MIFSGLALVGLSVLGAPLLFPSIWEQWRQVWWISPILFVVGLASLGASWHPSLRVQLLNPETGTMVDSFQPALAFGGWLAVMFSLAYFPLFGLYGDRRWI